MKGNRLKSLVQQIKIHWLKTKIAMGLVTPLFSEDRVIFEQEIQPYFIEEMDYNHILFVGCEYYTRHYNRWYRNKDFWTLDIDPGKKKYGAKQHIVDSFSNLQRHFANDSMDLILCNGLYGWGLCDRADADRAFNGCFDVLRAGGVLMVGWNPITDDRYKIPCPPEQLSSIRNFTRFSIPTRPAWRIQTKGSFAHAFDFYQKPLVPPKTDRDPEDSV